MTILEELKNNHDITFTKQQQEAMKHTEGPALVLAVPGSGKTTLLLARTANLIAEGKAKAEEILSVTFSKSSAMDMQERYTKLFGDDDLGDVKFSTIHALAYGIVMSYGKSQAIQYELIEGTTYKGYNKAKLLREIYLKTTSEYLSETEYDLLSTSVSYVKNHMKKQAIIDKVVGDLHLDGIDHFQEVLDQYEAYKLEHHMIDFDDMLVHSHDMLKDNPEILKVYADKYKYIQVDEAQDTSLIQHSIIDLIAGTSANLFYVADDDQAIYSFRGASPDYLLDIKDIYEQTIIYRLENNFRSTQAIVKLGNGFIKTNGKRYNKEMITDNPAGEEVAVVAEGDVKDQFNYIIDEIEKQGDQYKDNAILYRNNNSALIAAQILRAKKIPYYVKGFSTGFFEHWIIRDIFTIMEFAMAPTSAETFAGLFYKFKGYYISRAMIESIDGKEWNKSVFQRMRDYGRLDKRQKDNVKRLEEDFDKVAHMTPNEAIDHILDHMGYREYLVDRGVDGVGASSGDNPLVSTLRLLSAEVKDLDGLKEYLIELKADMNTSKDNKDINAVTLSTIHGAKGLEWRNVFIVGLTNGLFPNNRCLNSETMEDLEEERRIFYVGMTRAQELLVLCGKKESSKFLDEVTRLLNSNRTKKKAAVKELYVPNYSSGTVESTSSTEAEGLSIEAGMPIEHVKLGKGVVVSYDHPMVVINFNGIEKKLNYEFCSNSGFFKL